MLPGEAPVAGDDDELDLRAYLEVLRRRWAVIAAVVVLLAGAALAISFVRESTYRATAEVLIRPLATESLFGTDVQPRNAQEAARQLNNEVRVLESGAMVAAVTERYDGPLDPDDVSASVSSDTSDVVEVRLTSSQPEEAARLVDLYVDTFIELRRQQRVDELLDAGSEIQGRLDRLAVEIAEVRAPLDEVEERLAADPSSPSLQAQRDDVAQRLVGQLGPLENQRAFYQQQLDDLRLTAGIAQTGTAQVLTRAEVPTDPISPQPARDVAVAVVLGLILGVGAAFLLDNLDERIRSTADLARAAGDRSILAIIPELAGTVPADHVAVRDDPTGPAAEAYRSLRTTVKFAGIDRPVKVLQVTSPSSGEGKTTTVANLALSLAYGGDRVAVVCCDLRRPTLHTRFGQPLAPGLSDMIGGVANLTDALRRADGGVVTISAGTPPPNPSEMLSSNRVSAIVKLLADEFDYVVLDTTPVLPVTDALVVSRLVDATIVLADCRSTKRKALRRTLELLDQVTAPVLGVVLNGVPADDERYGYGYGYGYEAEPDEEKPRGRRLRRAAGQRGQGPSTEPAGTR